MRAILSNFGSIGDVQPMIALASELRRGGHTPVMVLAPIFRQYLKDLGFEYRPIGFDLDYPSLQRRDTEAALQGHDMIEVFRSTVNIFREMLPQAFDELREACHDADVLIAGNIQPAGRMIHELIGIPFVSIHTNHFGGKQPLSFRDAIASVLNPFRASHGLAPVEDPIHTGANSSQLALYAISRLLRPPDPSWPDHYHVTGFFFMSEDRNPDPRVLEFLSAGPPPVVFTFSSVAHSEPDKMTKILFETIERVQCRAVILSGWSGIGEGLPLPEAILVTKFVQHTWLFPRCACVVHAGGPGTAATALRWGIPSIVVPHINDQPLLAELLRGLGCVGDVIPYSEINTNRLAAALMATLSEPRYKQAALRAAAEIASEGGVAEARLLIEDLLSQNAFLHQAVSRDGAQPHLQQRRWRLRRKRASHCENTA